MYRIMRVKEGKAEVGEEETARKIKWDELVNVMALLEDRLGWARQDGTKAYTRDESESHKSQVLGESEVTQNHRSDVCRRRLPAVRQGRPSTIVTESIKRVMRILKAECKGRGVKASLTERVGMTEQNA